MSEHFIGLATIICLGIAAQWLAWRVHVPSILLLLLTGFVVGPITGWLRPDQLMGNLLFPVVSIAVAIILFEGGLSLQLSELKTGGRVIRNLTSVGALVTWVICTLAAHWASGLSWGLATLFGAIMVVTGPTVILPLLRHVRPSPKVGSILKWEGIVIDPIGASLAVIVFEVLHSAGYQHAFTAIILGVVKTVVVGGGVGLFAAWLMVILLKRHAIPDFLDSAVTLLMVVTVLGVANVLQHEAGLLAVTAMGVALANQSQVSVKHIIEFKENLRVLLISSLFVLLAARVSWADLTGLGWGDAFFLAAMLIVARPLSVLVSTVRSDLSWRECAFLAWMAPRGIVAASVASIFALDLVEAGHAEAARLVPLTFLVIVGTVTLYGLTAMPVARWLGVAQANPQGVLFVGAQTWARSIAQALQDDGFEVMLVDTNLEHVSAARMDGLPAWYGSILSDHAEAEIELSGLGRALAVTPNREVNSLAAVHMSEVFGRHEIYQLQASTEEHARVESTPRHLRGRILFGYDVSHDSLNDLFAKGAVVKRTKLSEEFGHDDFNEHWGEQVVPLFVKSEDGKLTVVTASTNFEPTAGQTLFSIVLPSNDDLQQHASADKAPGQGDEAGDAKKVS